MIQLNEDLRDCIIEGRLAKLTKTEYNLLRILVENKNKLCSRRFLLDEMGKKTPNIRYVDALITRIKGKINGGGIQTKTGYGYCLLDL